MSRVRTGLVAVSVAFASGARAQAPESHGLVGGFGIGAMHWTQGARRAPHDVAGGMYAGLRFWNPHWAGVRWSLTAPQLSIMMSRFRGIPIHADEIGVSRMDLGAQLAARIGAVRPYLLVALGRITTEQYADTNLVNYVSRFRPTFGGGVEVPFDNACGAGLDLVVRHGTARLDQGEWRVEGGNPPSAGPMQVWTVTLGWSGQFRGTRLLFACH